MLPLRKWKRKKRKNKHHILPKSRKGKTKPSNILILDEARHEAFHFLFHNRTLLEASALLKRTAEMKLREQM